MPTVLQAERLIVAGAELAEGPIRLADGAVAWVDILRGQVHRSDLGGETSLVTTLGEPVGAIAEATDGSLVAACRSGLRRIDPDGGPAQLLAALPDRGADLRMNDGKADPIGRFVGGTMTMGTPRPGAGSLWSFDGGHVTELVADLTISNGVAWSADATTIYHIDTPTRRIDAFDYDIASGQVAGRRTVVAIAAGEGDPDGMCIDADGGLWVALWGGGAVHRYVDGVLDAVIELPTPYVTCPVFAGPELDELVITTASEPFAHDVPAGAGDLYVARPGVTGQPAAMVDVGRVTTPSP